MIDFMTKTNNSIVKSKFKVKRTYLNSFSSIYDVVYFSSFCILYFNRQTWKIVVYKLAGFVYLCTQQIGAGNNFSLVSWRDSLHDLKPRDHKSANHVWCSPYSYIAIIHEYIDTLYTLFPPSGRENLSL
jgi:hypothetical protein